MFRSRKSQIGRSWKSIRDGIEVGLCIQSREAGGEKERREEEERRKEKERGKEKGRHYGWDVIYDFWGDHRVIFVNIFKVMMKPDERKKNC